MHPDVHCSIILNSQDMEATLVPINRWMEKEDVGCVCVCVCVRAYTHIYTYIYTQCKSCHLQQHGWI